MDKSLETLLKQINKIPILKVLECFGGIGAPRSALEEIVKMFPEVFKVKSVDYVEVLAHAVKAYNAMYDNGYFQQDVNSWNLNVDLVVHGSPCQDWSNAGKNDVTTGRSIQYMAMLDILENKLVPKAKYVVWENVVGLLSNKHIEHFEYYIKEMDRMGYDSFHNIEQLMEYGLPQSRKRVIVISIKKEEKQCFDFGILEKTPTKPLKEFLYYSDNNNHLNFKQPSMITALLNNKVKIIVDRTATITCKQIRWMNAGVVFQDESFYEQDFTLIPPPKSDYGYSLLEVVKLFKNYFSDEFRKDIETLNSMPNTQKDKKESFVQILCGKHKDEVQDIFRYLSARECWALQGFTANAPDFDEYTNFFTTPRSKDGLKINGSYNRIWNIEKHCGTIPSSVKLKIGFKDEDGILYHKFMTSEEAWLLLGYDLSQYDRVKKVGVTESDMYALAGNSIGVPMLVSIFKELLIDKKSVSNKYNSMDWLSGRNGFL